MHAELRLQSRTAIYSDLMFSSDKLMLGRSAKSFGENAAIEDAFFYLKERLQMAISFSRHIFGLLLEVNVKRKLISDRFLQVLLVSTLGYKSVMSNEAVCQHYHISSRRIRPGELLATAIEYYASFLYRLAIPKSEIFALLYIPIAFVFLRQLFRRIFRFAFLAQYR
jgi:hypothetical protein